MESKKDSSTQEPMNINIDELKSRAEKGDIEAQCLLGLHYEQGWDVQQNNYKAFEWYMKSAENGYTIAQRRLANCYKTGTLGLEKDYKKALYWYEKAGESIDNDSIIFLRELVLTDEKNSEYQYCIGMHYAEGKGVKQNWDEAFNCFAIAANQGHAESQYQLGLCYVLGRGVEANLKIAIKYFEKILDKIDILNIDEDCKAFVKYAVLAERGNVEAQCLLGLCYLKGMVVEKNWFEAISWFKEAAYKNYVEAQFLLGLCFTYYVVDENYDVYYDQEYDDEELDDAFYWFTKAANQGHTESQYRLGLCYAKGLGVEQNWKMAFELFTKAANQGHTESQYLLGLCYAKGSGVEQNWKIAFEWFTKAANQNHKIAQYLCTNLGKDTEINIEKAIEHYKNIEIVNIFGILIYEYYLIQAAFAKKSNTWVQYKLGMCYLLGKDVYVDLGKAIEYFQKAIDELDTLNIDEDCKKIVKEVLLAGQGNAEAEYQLGLRYAEGLGLEQNWEMAFDWFTKAANKGHTESQYQLGLCYAKGLGVKQNWEMAFDWFTKAANQGHTESQYQLGLCYAKGLGVKQNWEMAFDWFTKAANQDYAEAYYQLGLCYVSGRGVETNLKTANEFFEKILDKLDTLNICEDDKDLVKKVVFGQENAEAQYQLGLCLAGLEFWDEAFNWFAKAANQGHAESQYRLGLCYAEGSGVNQNWEIAFKWFTKAANQDYAEAYCQLGLCYALGRCVKKDFGKAIEYCKKIRNIINTLNISTNEKTFISKVILGEREDAETIYQLGVKYLKAGKRSRAKVCLDRAAHYGLSKAKGLL